jgi:hypothetical protein
MGDLKKMRLRCSKTIYFRLSTKKKACKQKMSEMRLARKAAEKYNI